MERHLTEEKRTTEEECITACQAGDREAFRCLFEAHKDRVYSMAVYTLGGDHAAADDVTQEVFVRVFTHIAQFRGEADFTTWLYRLVANACADEHRRRRRLVPLDTLPEQAGPRREEECETREDVRTALAELSPELRSAVLLKYFEELSYDEMAQALNCPKGTIASRLHRGLKLLARRLGPAQEKPLPKEPF
jgi:RNA polymerase sigma-70 factor (ECF subfamily)